MKILDIYTDGSHLKHGSGRLGIGGVIVDQSESKPYGKLLSEFSEELETATLRSKFGPGAENCSNPTAELTAVLVSLQKFGDIIKDADTIIIHADYIGVREWMTDSWKVREPYIANIKKAIQSEIRKLGKMGKVRYKWVKGHQKVTYGDIDAYWNQRCDLLAKGEVKDE